MRIPHPIGVNIGIPCLALLVYVGLANTQKELIELRLLKNILLRAGGCMGRYLVIALGRTFRKRRLGAKPYKRMYYLG